MIGQDPVRETSLGRKETGRRARTITGLKIDGVAIPELDKLVNDLLDLGDDMIFKLGPATVECAELVKSKARSKIKHDTGNLFVNGLIVKKPGRRSKHSHKRYRVFARLELTKEGAYGVPLELGHRLWFMGHKTIQQIEEKPFLRPAADESKQAVANIMIEALNDTLKEFGDK